MKKYTFYVDETHPEINLIYVSKEGDLSLEKHVIEDDDLSSAIKKLKDIIYEKE
jgi:hypothetical protein